jgi:hypothetical protein
MAHRAFQIRFASTQWSRLVIVAYAGIQVCSRRINLDTRFRGYDGRLKAMFCSSQCIRIFLKEVAAR